MRKEEKTGFRKDGKKRRQGEKRRKEDITG